jgi:YgiT-type zinc finger domain-containing protein
MKCGICKADMEDKQVTYTEDINNSVIVIRNVPALVCTECGNVWYSGTVAARLEKTVDAVVKTMPAEVAVINFVEHVA